MWKAEFVVAPCTHSHSNHRCQADVGGGCCTSHITTTKKHQEVSALVASESKNISSFRAMMLQAAIIEIQKLWRDTVMGLCNLIYWTCYVWLGLGWLLWLLNSIWPAVCIFWSGLLIVNGRQQRQVMQMLFAFVFFCFWRLAFFSLRCLQLLLVVSPFPLWHMFNKILFRVKQII